MPGTIVILMALGGLGCQNKGDDVYEPQSPSVGSGARYYANADAGAVAPSGSPSRYVRPDGGHPAAGYPGGALRATLLSFIRGHDDVPTAFETDALFYSGNYPFPPPPSAAPPPPAE
jgi:hypothetical protein